MQLFPVLISSSILFVVVTAITIDLIVFLNLVDLFSKLFRVEVVLMIKTATLEYNYIYFSLTNKIYLV